jgi:hypothetical protein
MLKPILKKQIAADAKVGTDDAGQYHNLKDDFASHEVVCHG